MVVALVCGGGGGGLTSASSIWPLRNVQPQPTSEVMPVSPGQQPQAKLRLCQRRRLQKYQLHFKLLGFKKLNIRDRAGLYADSASEHHPRHSSLGLAYR